MTLTTTISCLLTFIEQQGASRFQADIPYSMQQFKSVSTLTTSMI